MRQPDNGTKQVRVLQHTAKTKGTSDALRQEPWRGLLRLAADLIEEHGLAKNVTVCRATGAMCIRGAIMVADGRSDEVPYWFPMFISREATEADRAVACYLGVEGGWGVPDWNNHPDRSKEEVVAAMRAAAEA